MGDHSQGEDASFLCVASDVNKQRSYAFEKYTIDVEPIPLRLKKNREVHLHYIKCLKENVETLREIVEDDKVERPLDTSLASACNYTKHSYELLEYKSNSTNASGIPSTRVKVPKQASGSKLEQYKEIGTFASRVPLIETCKKPIIGRTDRPLVFGLRLLKKFEGEIAHAQEFRCLTKDTMADVNINAPADQAPAMAPPARTDEQILPRIRWVLIGKSNCYLDVERSQSNPTYKIAMDILMQTNFFRAFIASLTILSIYIQQDALQITPVDNNNAFSSPPTSDALIEFVNDLDSPLHLPTEEPVLGYLKFSAKGTEREVFGMPIPNDLITDDIQGKQYYNAYLEKVAKHQRYLAGEEVSDPDSPAPKPAKATTPKATKQSKPAPTKPQEKKRELVKETSEEPSPAKRSKAGKVVKKRKPKSPLWLIDKFVDEGVPDKEPVYGDEESDTQRAIEESLKEVHNAPRGPLPPVVIREPDSGKFQLLPDVQGKGKEKVSDEQVARDFLTLQTPKKRSPADQFIFQRLTPALTEPSGHEESSSLYAELGLTDSESKSDDEVSPELNPKVQDEGQTRPNPGEQDEGQARPNPGDAAVSQPPSSHGVHAGPNLEHMNLEASDTSIQPNPEQIDEEFTTTAYLNVQENLKLPTEGEVRLEEPTSSVGTLSSLQNLDKELSFTNLFLVDKSHEDEHEKTNIEAEVQSMVTVPIHQDTSSVPLMTTSVIDLTVSLPASTMVQASIPTSTATVTTTTTPLPP
ncbi:hypothetical protein Tco_0512047 [Tanacetum coccineum]